MTRDLLRRWSGRLSYRAADFDPTPLRVVSEQIALKVVDDVRAVQPLTGPGVLMPWAPPREIPEATMKARMAGRTAGVGMPGWHDGSGGAPVLGASLCRVADAAFSPEYGAVILRDGTVLHSSVAEALYYTPTLSALPWVTVGDDGPVLAPPAGTPSIERLAVFMAWGGRYNYGHFLIDCLSALMTIVEAGYLGSHTPVAPPLTPWQSELLSLLLGKDARRVRQTSEPLLLARETVFSTCMDHFLHAPNAPLDRARDRILASITAGDTGVRRIYLSRREDVKRRMVNELELEAALQDRGFTIVTPGTLDVARQVALFRDADVIVGPTGASLANCLFCKPGAKVVEIQPENFTGIWTRSICHFVNADWHAFFCESPINESDFVVEGVSRPGTLFQWRTPLPEFLAFLDERL